MDLDDEKQAEEESPASEAEPAIPPIDDNILEAPKSQPVEPPEKKPLPKQRLFIERITCTNFKSYYGTKDIGPFHKCFTAVVGANGSGKSNVIDAIIFVFGKRASKLRLKKLSELIHRSDGRPRCEKAKVVIHFCEIVDTGPETYEIIPGSKFKLSREVNQKSHTTYRIDGKPVKYELVRSLLLEKGVDLTHERYLILQGEVESISRMKPKGETPNEVGLLEYLEEIIGTDRYIEEIAKKGELDVKISDQCQIELSRLKAIEAARNVLLKDKEAAEEWIRLVIEKYKLQALLEHVGAWRKEVENSDYMDKMDEKMEKKNALEKDREVIMAEMAEILVTFKNQKKLVEDIKKEAQAKKGEFDKYDLEDQQVQMKIKEIRKEGKKTKKELKKILEQHEYAKKLIEEANAILPGMEEEKGSLSKELEKLRKERDEFMEVVEQRTAPIRKQLAEKQTELAPLAELKTKTQSQIKDAEAEIDLIQKQVAKMKDSYTEALKYIEKVKKEAKELKETGKMYVHELTKVHGEAALLIEEVGKKSKEAKNLEMAHQRKSDEYQRKKFQFQQQTNQDDTVNRLLKAQKNGELSGIFGRVGDLGSVPAEVDIAASTAGGKLLSYILVADSEAGQKCIEYLKREKLGRGRFLLLDKTLRYQSLLNSQEATPENCPRLLDFVECEDMFRTAFAQLFGNTLLCQDLEQANRVAYGPKRYRCVTRKGALIEKSGMMTGGGKPIKGRMKVQGKKAGRKGAPESFVSQEELDAIKNEMDEIDQQIKAVRADLRQLERTLERKKTVQNEWDMKCKQINARYMDKKEAEKLKKEQLGRLKEQSENTKKEEAAIAELKKKLGDLVGIRTKQEKDCRIVEQKIELLQSEIRKAGGAKLEEMQNELRQREESLQNLDNRITEQKVNKAAGEKTVSETEGKIEVKTKALEELAKKNAEFEARKKELEELCQPVLKEYQELTEKETAEEAKLKEYHDSHGMKTKEKKDIEKTLRALRKEFGKLKVLVEQNCEKVRELEVRAKRLVHSIHTKQKCFADSDPWQLPEKTEEVMAPIWGESEHFPKKIEELTKKIRETNVNQTAIIEWQKKEEQYAKQNEVYSSIEGKRAENNRKLTELRERRTSEFLTGFTTITRKLKEMYQLLTFGGDADLELVDSHDPFAEGIRFTVRPPKKSWKEIQNISGGEKTLSSLSLVFALHHYQPAALYVMDEIDAALDFRNVSIVANYIKRETQNAQFIIISLRNQMFDLSNRMVGIYKINNSTESITFNPNSVTIGKLLEEADEEVQE